MSVATRSSLLINQAAERAGVSRRTMYYWIASSKVESFRTSTGSTRVYVDSLANVKRFGRSKSVDAVVRGAQ